MGKRQPITEAPITIYMVGEKQLQSQKITRGSVKIRLKSVSLPQEPS